MSPRAAALAVVVAVAMACGGPGPTPALQLPVADAETAFAIATRIAEIGGPFQQVETVSGRFEDLDPESHNAPSDPAAVARWEALADRQVWLVTFEGPAGIETVVIDAQTGERLAAVVQGQ